METLVKATFPGLDLSGIVCQKPAEDPEGEVSSPQLLLCCRANPDTEGADSLQFSCEKMKNKSGNG